jgi:hypothetical protein
MSDLTTIDSIQSNIFVRIQVDQYRTTSGGSYNQQILKFSDYNGSYVINGETYIGLGNLMGITSTTSEVKASSNELSITISGIPDSAIAEIVHSKIKGSPVRIYRALFNPVNGTLLSLAENPIARYRGFVNNYSLTEDWNQDDRLSTNTITLICASSLDVLSNKMSGRRTNPVSEKLFYPTDVSMDRVPTLENATFNFGAPK